MVIGNSRKNELCRLSLTVKIARGLEKRKSHHVGRSIRTLTLDKLDLVNDRISVVANYSVSFCGERKIHSVNIRGMRKLDA